MDYEKIQQTAGYINSRLKSKPEIAIILGSGLSYLADLVEEPIIIYYGNVPNFPTATVQGHGQKLVAGCLFGREVILMTGRFHCYEGYSMSQVALPVAALALCGVKKIIITNAAGGINENYAVGDFMFIRDHIKLCAENPLMGKHIPQFGERFPDISALYTPAIRKIAKENAHKLGITAHEGVFAYMMGPTYETPAEIHMLKILGADAVAMSTVPEAIVASATGMEVLGISCITNILNEHPHIKLSHEDVVIVTNVMRENFVKLIEGTIKHCFT
jgi:purine-nucleoside phosphorylase